MHILQVPFFFSTRTGFASHLEYLTGRMKPAASRRCTSSAMARRRSSLKGRSDCLTCRALGSVLSLCSASSLGTPGMTEGFHAKMSQFSRRNSMSALSYAGLMPVPIVTVWMESPGTSSMERVCVVASNAVEPPFSELGFFNDDPARVPGELLRVVGIRGDDGVRELGALCF